MTEEVTEGAEAPANDDLRSIITAAVDRQRSAQSEAAPAAESEPKVEAETASPEADEGKDGRARDENGRFKAADKPQDASEPKNAPKAEPKVEAAPEAPQAEPNAHRPPPGWSPKSKAAFDNLPAEVKADIAKREVEVNQGLAKLADYKPIERFNEMAKRGGTTLETALTAYTNTENLLRRDPISGVEQICQNLRLDPRTLVGAMAQRYGLTMQPVNGQQPQQNPAQQQIQLPQALIDELSGLKSSLSQIQQDREAQEWNSTNQNVETFFNDPKNKYADNVADIMAGLINQAKANGERVNLSTIYDQACWMHPEVRELLISEKLAASNPVASNAAKAQVAADQARQAAKAVTGAPTRGVPPGNAPPANESTADTIRRAIAEQRSRV